MGSPCLLTAMTMLRLEHRLRRTHRQANKNLNQHHHRENRRLNRRLVNRLLKTHRVNKNSKSRRQQVNRCSKYRQVNKKTIHPLENKQLKSRHQVNMPQNRHPGYRLLRSCPPANTSLMNHDPKCFALTCSCQQAIQHHKVLGITSTVVNTVVKFMSKCILKALKKEH